jgi:ABC-type polar amino acid transport system ATPase subunit
MIRVENLNKHINGLHILKNVNLEIPVGKVLGVIGVSGSGKTTLLMCLCGLLEFESGTIKLNSLTIEADTYNSDMEKIWTLRKETGVVFQHLYLFPHLSALGNIIEAPIHVFKKPREEAEKEALDLLSKVGLANCANKYPDELSGGEQQRVAICRALAMKPNVLFLDEPTSALDPQRSSDIRNLLNDFVKGGSTLVIVSHSLNFLKGLADYLTYMEAGEVIEFGKSEDVINNPKDDRTKFFLEHF